MSARGWSVCFQLVIRPFLVAHAVAVEVNDLISQLGIISFSYPTYRNAKKRSAQTKKKTRKGSSSDMAPYRYHIDIDTIYAFPNCLPILQSI